MESEVHIRSFLVLTWDRFVSMTRRLQLGVLEADAPARGRKVHQLHTIVTEWQDVPSPYMNIAATCRMPINCDSCCTTGM